MITSVARWMSGVVVDVVLGVCRRRSSRLLAGGEDVGEGAKCCCHCYDVPRRRWYKFYVGFQMISTSFPTLELTLASLTSTSIIITTHAIS